MRDGIITILLAGLLFSLFPYKSAFIPPTPPPVEVQQRIEVDKNVVIKSLTQKAEWIGLEGSIEKEYFIYGGIIP